MSVNVNSDEAGVSEQQVPGAELPQREPFPVGGWWKVVSWVIGLPVGRFVGTGLRIVPVVSLLLIGLSLAVTDPESAGAQEPETVWVNKEEGNDATCVRGDSNRPCKTAERAHQIAQPGDKITTRTYYDIGGWSVVGIAAGAAAAGAAIALGAWYVRRRWLRQRDLGRPAKSR